MLKCFYTLHIYLRKGDKVKKKTVKSLAVLMAGTLAATTFLSYGGTVSTQAAENWIGDDELSAEVIGEPVKNTVLPNNGQLQYQREDSFAAFLHFGPNTFNNKEWGDSYGNKPVNELFNTQYGSFTDFDAEGYVKMIKNAGFSRLVVVAKHHDGFCLWQSDYTQYDMEGVTSYKNGQGDVLAELSAACSAVDLDMGLYLSPWDINAPSYNQPVVDGVHPYNTYYNNQLEEILSDDKYGNNGKFVEIWMDGAKGSGVNAPEYDFGLFHGTIVKYETEDCLIFQANEYSGVRWIGNESGYAGEETWANIKFTPGQKNSAHNQYYDDRIVSENGTNVSKGYPNDTDGTNNTDKYFWTVPEVDARITPGWFWGTNNKTPKSLESLVDMYFNSIGHNATFLLNIPINSSGTVDKEIKDRLTELTDAVKATFGTDGEDKNLANAATAKADSVYGNNEAYKPGNVLDGNPDTYWAPDDNSSTGSLMIDLGEAKTFDIVSIEEAIQNGQRIESFNVQYKLNESDSWQELGSGSTIGSKRLLRTSEVSARYLKITVTATDVNGTDKDLPQISEVKVYKASKNMEIPSIIPKGLTGIDNVDFQTTGSWTKQQIQECFDKTSMWSGTKGDTATFEFTGTMFYLYGTVDSGHGEAKIYIDGELADTIDTSSSTRRTNALLYASDALEDKAHTVKIEVVSKAIGLDAAAYLDNGGKGLFEFEVSEMTMEEGSTATLKIYRKGGTTGTETVTVNFEPGSAVQNFFNTTPVTLTFEEGETYKEVQVETYRIGADEVGGDKGDTNFYVTMASDLPLGSNDEVTVTILDLETHYNAEILRELVASVEDRRDLGYEAGIWTAFTDALKGGYAALAEDNATAEIMRDALNTLEAAVTALDNAVIEKGDFGKGTWSKAEVSSEHTTESFDKAFDGQAGTNWHSNYGSTQDKLINGDAANGTLESISGVINLGEARAFNQFSFTPRTSPASGLVTEAMLYVSDNGTDFVPLYEANQTFAANNETKTFDFPTQNAQYIKFEAFASNDGWVAVSEFDINLLPEKEYIIEAIGQTGSSVSVTKTNAGDGEQVTATVTMDDPNYEFAGWYDLSSGQLLSESTEYSFAAAKNTGIVARTNQVNIPIETVTIVEGAALSLNVNGTATLNINVTPVNATEQVSFLSSDPNVAAVDILGNITALRAGQATITASAPGGASASIVVTVNEAATPSVPTDPIVPSDPTVPSNPVGQGTTINTSNQSGALSQGIQTAAAAVRTGDGTDIVLWAALLGAACTVVGLTIVVRKRRG